MDTLFQWVSRLKDRKLLGGKSILEATRYRGFAFWWFLRNRCYSDLRGIFKSGAHPYGPATKQVIIGRFSFPFLTYILLLALISKLMLLLLPPRRRVKGEEKKILLTAQFNAWKLSKNIATGKLEKAHDIFHPIMVYLSKERAGLSFVSCIPFGFTILRNLGRAFEMRQSTNIGEFKPLESYLTWKVFIAVFRAKKHFTKTLHDIEKTLREEAYLYRGTNISNVLRTCFGYYCRVYLPLMVLYFELSLQALRTEKPRLVMMINEYGGFERALLLAAHTMGVPSLAIQHGIIHRYHPGYMYGRDEVSPDGSAQFPYAPLPTKTAVYGPYYKEILTQCSSYPEEAVIVTGQPRYDILHLAERRYDREKFCRRYGLDPSTKIALIATQPFSLKERREFFDSTIQALSKIGGVQVVVKPHHRESREWYVEQLEELGVKALVLPPRYDTFEAIYSCDLLISVTSTTILEALILGKTAVSVNILGLPEIMPWVRDGAVLGVYKRPELLPTLRRALIGGIRQEKRRTFVRRHVYKVDGRATERVTSLVLKMCTLEKNMRE